MVEANALNAAIENYLDKVDDYITAYGMSSKRGTEVLDPIQEEVDATLSRVRAGASKETITAIRIELNRSLERIDSALCSLEGQSLSALGELPRARSASDGGAWAQCTAKVTAEISRVTSRFNSLLVNMDDNRRNQFDTNFARIVDQCNAQMQRATGDDGAAACTKWALGEVSKIEAQLAALQQKSAAEMMSVMIQEKDAERLSLISQAKSLEKSLTESDHKVINMHNGKAMGILNEMANNATTFDGAVRDAKFRLVDKHLANIHRIVQMHAFASDMAGGMFTSQKSLVGINSRAARSHNANFTTHRKYKQAAPPRNTRAGRISGLGSADTEQGFFELSPPEPMRPLGERTINTVMLGTGVALLGYMALRGGR